ncbi:hypothetical protein RJ226_004025 [Enterobacter hormaechei]|nr:hypothetical protein [Enterobacter hormaechei]ELD3190813.1 hypothetical protein [Enterobacter hormaechei]
MSEEDTYEYVNIDVQVKDDATGEYRAIRQEGFGVAARPFKGDFIRVDGHSYEVVKVEFDTERGAAHYITVYVA